MSEEEVKQTVRIPDETDDPAAVAYEEVQLDFPRDLILEALGYFAETTLTEISCGIVEEAIEKGENPEVPLSHVFEQVGRAVFNDIIGAAIDMKLREEGIDPDDLDALAPTGPTTEEENNNETERKT